MRILVLATLCMVISASQVAPVLADETIEVHADSTMAGNDGFVLRITGSDFGQSLFAFHDGGFIRLYAFREYGSQDWEVTSSPQYLCPASSMSIDDTWTFLDDDFGNPTTARVIALESVTTTAGTFSAYRVDITTDTVPSEHIETMWFADGVGFVRNQGYAWGWMDWRDELTNYTIVGGSGYMPLAVGNSWTHAEVAVSADKDSWGGVKAQYR